MAITGRIHSFESFGAVDGPGIRYVVFFQGCPLRCIYCHNPDTWPPRGGQEVTVEEIVDRVLPYQPFLRRGGVPLTGGEPLLQSAFVYELTKALHTHGLHVAIDTAGSIPLEQCRAAVDEAHKLPDAARQMYTEKLSEADMDDLCLQLQQAHYLHLEQRLRSTFLAFSISCGQNLSRLRRKDSVSFTLTPFRREALADCIAILQYAGAILGMPRYLRHRLGEAESFFRLFLLEVPTRILYIDYDADGKPTFCAASSRVPQLLRSALWNTREPAILTSGTLAAAGDFSHTEQLLGLTTYRPLRHFRADSPFNYKKKCLLYFPPRTKTRMDNRRMAEEIVRLVGACHGHALVLFTAYRQMAEVRALTDGQWQYPTYQAWRNGGKIIQKFKQSGNGVLFAAGSCWEGIDFPGDMVSLLIIAKLPFPIPDPVSNYERRQYPNLRDYINAEIIPEMQKKLRQGFGRAIRTEQDSCVVAILDERAGIGGKYHDAALAALPTCPIIEKIEDVQQFIREQKSLDYFL